MKGGIRKNVYKIFPVMLLCLSVFTVECPVSSAVSALLEIWLLRQSNVGRVESGESPLNLRTTTHHHHNYNTDNQQQSYLNT